jgi:uncharacterized protein YndB with AHSA1/START domain
VPASPAVTATTRIAALPEAVFPYFTDPALIVTWMGDRADLDPQPGGVFAVDVGASPARGTYLVVEPGDPAAGAADHHRGQP